MKKRTWRKRFMAQPIDKKTIQIQVGVAIAVLLAIIGAAYALGTQTSEIKSQIREIEIGDTHIIQNLKEDQARITALEKQNNELNVELASIKTKLASIELGIQEIKVELREHNKNPGQ
jgi:septal ring factor EnvC (AmiA/AmiB activator)